LVTLPVADAEGPAIFVLLGAGVLCANAVPVEIIA